MVIANKSEMYRLLAAGELGNTIPQFFSIEEWERSADSERYPLWGVRTMVPGGPCRLNCPREEVRATALLPEYAAAKVNISMMIDAATRVTLWGEAFDSDAGLMLYGIEYPPVGGSWRKEMPTKGRSWYGLAAVMLLRKHLNANSLDDLMILRDQYPGHVYEFSACETCIGVIPNRNAITWEVRAY